MSAAPLRRWRPSPFLRLSAGMHLGGAAALAAAPSWWPMVAAALVADHAVAAAAGLWPRSSLLGPNLVRLPRAAAARGEVALTFDDGPDPEVTPRVLELLAAARVRASFFLIGERAASCPRLVREMAGQGHTIGNHSQRHRHGFAFLAPRQLRREIETAQRVLGEIVGWVPAWFRAPAGIRSPLLDPVLARLGLGLVSWTRRGYDGVDRRPAAVLRRLRHGLAAGDILLLHDGRGAGGRPPTPVLEVLPALLDEIRRRGLSPAPLPPAAATPR